jgi:hypothetical protein
MTFAQDVFISFTHIDNQSLNPDEDGWISTFHKALEIRLSQLRGQEPQIWRDRKLQGNSYLRETIFDTLAQTALLVSVLSPRYLESAWCMDELRHFCEEASRQGGLRVGDNKARLFKVVKTYLPLEQHPAEFAAFLGYEFFEFDDAGRPQEFDRIYGPERERQFYAKLNDLAYDIHQTLELLKAQRARSRSGGHAPQPTRPMRKVIYLADTTPDLHVSRERIRRELEQAGHQVLPEQPLPSEPATFKQAVCEALTRSQLSIHLLSPYASGAKGEAAQTQEQIYRQLAMMRTRDQIELADQCGQERADFSRLLWLPPDAGTLEPDEFVTSLQNDPNFISTNLEAFKDIIHTHLAPPATFEGVDLPTDGKLHLYLDCDERDLDMPEIDPLFEWLDQHFRVILPDYDNRTLSRSEAMIQQCEAVLIFYGQASALWLKRRLNALKKTLYGRPKPLRAKAVYVADPSKQRFSDPEVPMIEGYHGFQPTLLEGFLASLGMTEGRA